MTAFIQQYERVFDRDGNMRPVGREACKKLIELAQAEGVGCFGSVETGVVNLDAVKDLYLGLKEVGYAD